MYYNFNLHNRQSIRLKCYDYSQSCLYFVTINLQNNVYLFGEIVDGEMLLNEYGEIVQMVWNELPQHYDNIQLGEFVVMPNHIHGIIIITDVVGAGFKPAPTDNVKHGTAKHGLPEIVRALKTFSARKINELRNTRGEKLWQRNYYEIIIRNERSYQRITNYIIDNPKKWNNDKYYKYYKNYKKT